MSRNLPFKISLLFCITLLQFIPHTPTPHTPHPQTPHPTPHTPYLIKLHPHTPYPYTPHHNLTTPHPTPLYPTPHTPTLGCVILRTFFQIMLLISPVDLLYAPNSLKKFQSNPMNFNPPPYTVYINTCFQWAKLLILAVWPHSPNYASVNFFEFLIMFADHENLVNS